MPYNLVARINAATIPITPLTKSGLTAWLKTADRASAQWVQATGFTATPGEIAPIPAGDAGNRPGAKKGNAKTDSVTSGSIGRVLFGVSDKDHTSSGIWDYATLANKLAKGRYTLESEFTPDEATRAALGWALAQYRFDRYTKPKSRPTAELVWPAGADRGDVARQADGISLTRNLINTPAGDLGPAELAAEASALAKKHKARCTVIVGDKLLSQNYPAIHAVGRASAHAPRLIDIRWGRAKDPKITLVGKGVTFDSGGLDIKPAAGMLMMKKDMGGAAQVLGLASMIMDAGLRVRLRVLVPAVENAISGNAFHPMDILPTRKGITVEVGNTDAEGRLILCDALAEADAEKPALIVDFATLTGAARVALGAELPALFANDDAVASEYLSHGTTVADPLWRMPLWQPYNRMLDSKTADVSSTGSGGHGGAVTAALFLERFVSPDRPWMHIDLMAWNGSDRPGRPEGGEAMGIRALYGMLRTRYGSA